MTDDFLRDDQPVSFERRTSSIRKFKMKDRRMSKTRSIDFEESKPKKPRTSEDFYLFCKFILEYENYDVSDKEDSQDLSREDIDKKLDKNSDLTNEDEQQNSVVEMSSDEDSYDLVTCFCGKPFAGRPMIECSKCLTWIHLRCAKVKKSDIPDVFICSHCKTAEEK
ncbi:unnamed protein product [Nezara viridula]|uniref:Zinc finger PHD-type domain-containing protein n=1 Tax=Nezara viridula TaxID=85310 RepID=A0A9P0E5Q2_NEZVI|nr:unnamed protein product [Nezara viridula]